MCDIEIRPIELTFCQLSPIVTIERMLDEIASGVVSRGLLTVDLTTLDHSLLWEFDLILDSHVGLIFNTRILILTEFHKSGVEFLYRGISEQGWHLCQLWGLTILVHVIVEAANPDLMS